MIAVRVLVQAITSELVNNEVVHLSAESRFPPMIRGDRKIDQSVIMVRCSSCVNLVSRTGSTPGLGPRCPSGSMSASGQLPRAMCGAHFAVVANC